MTEKKYMLIDHEGNHDYNIFINTVPNITCYTMFRSNSDSWEEDHKNKLVLSMDDNGDNLTFKTPFEQKMEYFTALELRLLLDFHNKMDGQKKLVYNVIEAIGITQL
jgi:hypothetical protein